MDHMIDLVLRSDIFADESVLPDLSLRRDLAGALDAIKQRTLRDNINRPEPLSIQYQCLIHHLDLQFGFVKAWICRPALHESAHPEPNTTHGPLQKDVAAICLESLRECLYAFVRFNSLCNYATRSWSVIHNGLSSALLLALTGELRRDPHLHATLGELLDIFEASQTDPGGGDRTMDYGTNLSPAYTRAIVALRKMYVHDSNINEAGNNISTTSQTIPPRQDTVNPSQSV
jgi:hypothetical protein